MKAWKSLLTYGFLVAFWLGRGTISGQTQIQYDGSSTDIEIVKKATYAYAAGDWDTLASVIDPGATCYYFRGVDSIRMDKVMDLWKEDRINIDSIIMGEGAWLPIQVGTGFLAGNYIFQWNEQTVYYKDGKKVFLPFHTVNKVKNGRLRSVHFFYDQLKVMAQLGYKVIPPKDQ